MSARTFFLLGLLGLAVACGSTGGDAPAPPPPGACDADEEARADGTCELFAAAASCGPGTRPAIGARDCVPVGPTSCAAGFEPDASGWGCQPIMADVACTGATRPRLGDRACVPVGDCSAAFPPAGAIVVDPALADGAVDATHVKTLADAASAATDGATIALADGTHAAAPVSLSKAVTIIGRCAERARLVAAPGSAPEALRVYAKVTLRGLTLEGQTEPISILGPGDLLAEDIVIEGARQRAIFAQRAGKATLRRSVVRATAPANNEQTIAVLAGSSAQLTLDDSAVLGSVDGAVGATGGTSTRVTIQRSIVKESKPRPVDKKGGGAVRAFEGAHVDVVESAILDATGMAILALRRDAPPPEVTVARSVIRGTVPTDETGTTIGTAINAAYEAKVTVEESTIADSEGHALYAAEKADITLKKSVVVRVRRTRDISGHGGTSQEGSVIRLDDSAIVGAGALGLGGWRRGKVVLNRSLIRDVGGDVVEGFTMGMGFNVTEASVIEATDSAIVDALEIGASALGPGSGVFLDRVLITRSDGAAPSVYGHGVLSIDAAAITLTRSIVERQQGVGLFYASGGGVVRGGSVVRANGVGVHVQEGSSLVEVASPPDVAPEHELVVTSDTRFVGNQSRSGSGVIPLPAPLRAPE
ncbi:MAG: hypothetical protein KF819_31800 [Labilithrix sp.]|nr:hypothetical protein [Labilithrix sp.]